MAAERGRRQREIENKWGSGGQGSILACRVGETRANIILIIKQSNQDKITSE